MGNGAARVLAATGQVPRLYAPPLPADHLYDGEISHAPGFAKEVSDASPEESELKVAPLESSSLPQTASEVEAINERIVRVIIAKGLSDAQNRLQNS